MKFVETYKDLEVYKLARELAKEIFEQSLLFPKEEMYSLTDQVRRSSRSVGANIAESWPTDDTKNLLKAGLPMA